MASINSTAPPSIRACSRMGRVTRHRGPRTMKASTPMSRSAIGMRRTVDHRPDGWTPTPVERDGSLWIVCNGEIYNFRELRRQSSEGPPISRRFSDCEVILYLYASMATTSFIT